MSEGVDIALVVILDKKNKTKQNKTKMRQRKAICPTGPGWRNVFHHVQGCCQI